MKALYKYLIFSIVASFLFIGCDKLRSDGEGDSLIDDITVVDGHLDFRSSGILLDYLDSVREGSEGATRSAAGVPVRRFDGFTSIADRLDDACFRATRAGEDDSEMEDEYAAVKASELLFVEELTHVLDTNLVIAVDDKIYKITEYGTFYMDKDQDFSVLEDAIAEFNSNVQYYLSVNEECQFAGGVTFFNSFSPEGMEMDVEEEEEGETRASSGSVRFDGPYNVKTFNWFEDDNLLNKLFGRKVNKFNEFDSSHRVAVQLYNINYVFWQSAGVRVELQEKQYIGRISFWRSVAKTQDEMVLGINMMSGKSRIYTSDQNLIGFNYKNFTGFNAFSSDNRVYIYGYADTVPFVRNFKGERGYNFVVPRIKFQAAEADYTDRTKAAEIYDMKITDFSDILHYSASKTGKMSNPTVMVVPFPSSNTKFKNTRTGICGLKEYWKKSSAEVTFIDSGEFGITLSLGGVAPKIGAANYNVENIDVFGAIKYNGKWRGVRFVTLY